MDGIYGIAIQCSLHYGQLGNNHKYPDYQDVYFLYEKAPCAIRN